MERLFFQRQEIGSRQRMVLGDVFRQLCPHVHGVRSTLHIWYTVSKFVERIQKR